MEKISRKAVDAAAKIVKQMGDIEMLGWPPFCMGTFYQPERPIAVTDENSCYDSVQNKQ